MKNGHGRIERELLLGSVNTNLSPNTREDVMLWFFVLFFVLKKCNMCGLSVATIVLCTGLLQDGNRCI